MCPIGYLPLGLLLGRSLALGGLLDLFADLDATGVDVLHELLEEWPQALEHVAGHAALFLHVYNHAAHQGAGVRRVGEFLGSGRQQRLDLVVLLLVKRPLALGKALARRGRAAEHFDEAVHGLVGRLFGGVFGGFLLGLFARSRCPFPGLFRGFLLGRTVGVVVPGVPSLGGLRVDLLRGVWRGSIVAAGERQGAVLARLLDGHTARTGLFRSERGIERVVEGAVEVL